MPEGLGDALRVRDRYAKGDRRPMIGSEAVLLDSIAGNLGPVDPLGEFAGDVIARPAPHAGQVEPAARREAPHRRQIAVADQLAR